MTKNERMTGVLSLLCVTSVAAIFTLVLSIVHIKTSIVKANGKAQYSEQLQCIRDNKKLLATLRIDSTLPMQERLLRSKYTRAKIARCREDLPRYLRYKDLESDKKVQASTLTTGL